MPGPDSSKAIPAATLIVVRDVEGGPPELLMVERAQSMAFAPGAWVFPGGRVDPSDRNMGSASQVEDSPDRIAAIRETIEECAVPIGLGPVPDRARAVALQRALLSGVPFDALIESTGLRIEPDALTPFARWVPGPEVSRRFDTRFYVAEAAADWDPHVGSAECSAAIWVSARQALARDMQGGAKLIYPTRKNLERLAQFSTTAEILADARAHPIVPITARIAERSGEQWVSIPEGLGYPNVRDRLGRVWRG